jgi:hypothetical protein
MHLESGCRDDPWSDSVWHLGCIFRYHESVNIPENVCLKDEVLEDKEELCKDLKHCENALVNS